MQVAVPKTFELGGRLWTVILVDVIPGEGADTYGLCDSHAAKVYIKKGMTPDETRHTFYHELEHAFRATLGLPDGEDEHGEVDARGNLLYQYLKKKQGRHI